MVSDFDIRRRRRIYFRISTDPSALLWGISLYPPIYLCLAPRRPPVWSLFQKEASPCFPYIPETLSSLAAALPFPEQDLITVHWSNTYPDLPITSIKNHLVQFLSWECHHFASVTRRTCIDQEVVNSFTGIINWISILLLLLFMLVTIAPLRWRQIKASPIYLCRRLPNS